MADTLKTRLMKVFADNLQFFFPHFTHHFMCPICLQVLDIVRDENEITKAHLIPKVAGGAFVTLLCRPCNSRAGAKQDKPFGELLRLYKEGEDILKTKLKERSFAIDGLKTNGHWDLAEDGGLTFYIYSNRNSPRRLEALLQHFANRPAESRVRFNIPLLANTRYVNLGYLTMAYLFYFAYFGYSWVLQSHLHQVRQQIMYPDEQFINEKCFAKTLVAEEQFDVPHFASANISGTQCASILYQDVMVSFPTPQSKSAYRHLQDVNEVVADLKFLHFPTVFLASMISVSHESKLLMFPDALGSLAAAGMPWRHILFAGKGNSEPFILYPVSVEEAREAERSSPTVLKFSMDARGERSFEPHGLLTSTVVQWLP